MPPVARTTGDSAGQVVYPLGDWAPGREPNLRVWRVAGGLGYRFRYADGTEFLVDRSGNRVWCTWPEPYTLEDAATYLLGPVFAFLLRLRGNTCLHASAVVVADRAVAFLGATGAGKSTTAVAFARRGHTVLSDDVCVLHADGDGVRVQPGYPYLRLWPDSVKSLFGSADALPRLTPVDGVSAWWDKRFLDLDEHGYPFQRQPLRLGAIYVLGERSSGPESPFVEPLIARDALMALVANTHARYLLDRAMRAREFELLGRVVACVPVRRLIPGAEADQLPRLCEVVVNDVATRLDAPTLR
jgi:hypothetical protein